MNEYYSRDENKLSWNMEELGGKVIQTSYCPYEMSSKWKGSFVLKGRSTEAEVRQCQYVYRILKSVGHLAVVPPEIFQQKQWYWIPEATLPGACVPIISRKVYSISEDVCSHGRSLLSTVCVYPMLHPATHRTQMALLYICIDTMKYGISKNICK